MALLLAKGDDFTSWRGVEEFAVAYRDAAVKMASRLEPSGVAQTLELLENQLAVVKEENRSLELLLERLLLEIDDVVEPEQLRSIFTAFYEGAYRHFARFGSPTAFFHLSKTFLSRLSACCLRLARQQIEADIPPLALLAMGPAGRLETTRFCRVQLMMVWEGTAPDKLAARLSKELVTWFRVCGVILEENVTPLNPDWRGGLEQWQARFEAASRKKDRSVLIELLRLADSTILAGDAGVAERFVTLSLKYLSNRNFVSNLVGRCMLLTNGINMMGGLRLEKSGPHRGAFPLLDHAFLPLASSVAAICLLHRVNVCGTPERLRELVRIGKLDVDLAERALHAWNCFCEYRLMLEQKSSQGQDCRNILHLMPSSLTAAESERLRQSLETVADLQRNMQVSFGAYT